MRNKMPAGFSLIELVIVVVIIAIIAAIAIPKMSRGAAGANDSATSQDLSTMRSALDLYAGEHNSTYPIAANVLTQLTQFTDINGNVSSTKTSVFLYGPYLKSVPALPVGTNKGLNTITTTGPAGTGSFGWFYDGTTMWVNDPNTDVDVAGTAYNTY